MIKCETIEKFNIANFKALKNIERAGIEKEGTLFIGDTFECDEEMAKYLTGENVFKRSFVKIIEVEPAKVVEETTKGKKVSKKTSKAKK